MHSRHILPLSITDYVARFSLELVVLGIGLVCLFTNFSLLNHSNNISSTDQSILFSFIKNNPQINSLLIRSSDTSTIRALSDQQVSTNLFQGSLGVTVAEAFVDNNTLHSDPTTIQDDVAVKTNPADTENFPRHGLTKYEVTSGDTITGIASSFGISPQTIMMENKINESTILKPGTELTILPTTGITHTLTKGETLESILKKYKITEDAFLDANNIESFEDLDTSAVVVIPMNSVSAPAGTTSPSKFVNDTSNKIALKQAQAPEGFSSGAVSFIWPTPVRTITQGFSSRHTGIDISNSHMEPIYAAADGFVEISGFQANGYGNTIVINHGSGFKTRYGHASELYVAAGQYVTRGQLIAKQGRTGRVSGVTGIHLHFEIIKNGVKVNPLGYVHP